MLWIKRIVFVFALAPLVMCQAADEAFKAGEHYDILPQVVRTANSEKIEINEFIYELPFYWKIPSMKNKNRHKKLKRINLYRVRFS